MSANGIIPLQVFTLSITLQAPYLVHGNDAGRYGLHATLLRDHRRRPVLPGTLLAGRIAEVWKAHGEVLGQADPDEWFGEPGEDEARQKGRRARLRVADLTLQTIEGEPFDLTKPTHEFDATRVQLDQDTGSVRHGALLAVEQVSLPGAELTFEGEWHVRADQGAAETLRKQLLVALQLQTQIGAWRNIGFGRVLKVEVTRKVEGGVTRRPMPPGAWADGRRRFALTSDDALCLSASTQRGNVFVSVDHVSGGTIKGVLARMLTERHGVKSLDELPRLALARHFDKVRVTHALPAKHEGKRPVPLPQSLVSLGGGKIRDAFRHAAPPDTLSGAVAFQTDWKGTDFETASANQGWGETRSYLRVRTDINGEGQAKDGALFAYDWPRRRGRDALAVRHRPERRARGGSTQRRGVARRPAGRGTGADRQDRRTGHGHALRRRGGLGVGCAESSQGGRPCSGAAGQRRGAVPDDSHRDRAAGRGRPGAPLR